MITPSIRVLLVDDHAIVREGLRTLLSEESDLEVVGEAGDGVESVKLIAILQPHVVRMDLVMPGMDGIQTMRNLRVASPSGHVLVLTNFGDEQRVRDAIQEVLQLIVRGQSNKEIAASLGVTEGTVKGHVSAILSKLGVADRTQAALYAVKHGLGPEA